MRSKSLLLYKSYAKVYIGAFQESILLVELQFDQEKLNNFNTLFVSNYFRIQEEQGLVKLFHKETESLVDIKSILDEEFSHPNIRVRDFIHNVFEDEVIVKQRTIPIYSSCGNMSYITENIRLGVLFLEDAMGVSMIRSLYNPIHSLRPYESLRNVKDKFIYLPGTNNFQDVQETHEIVKAFMFNDVVQQMVESNSIMSFLSLYYPTTSGHYSFSEPEKFSLPRS